MGIDSIRSRHDRDLFASLVADQTVQKVNETIARSEEEGQMGVRRRLLGNSVRLSERMAPSVHRVAEQCGQALEIDIPLELFVYPSPRFNAACLKPEEGRLFVIFSSGLLEYFAGSELQFVVGHELGHHVFQHFQIPIGHILQGPNRPDPKLALELFAWSRYAEISADRAGALCAGNLDSVARALFKLASGLSGQVVEFRLEDFLAQVDDMQEDEAEPGRRAAREDWFSTHPFSPIRVRALQLFHESELSGDGGLTADELEDSVQGLMSLMEPSYIDGRTQSAETMRRLLFAGAIAVAQADGEITAEEIAVFEKFMGKGSFGGQLDVDHLIADLPVRIEEARKTTSLPQRMQVLRDICLVATADGSVGKQERAELDRIAGELGIPRTFINQAVEACFSG